MPDYSTIDKYPVEVKAKKKVEPNPDKFFASERADISVRNKSRQKTTDKRLAGI
jgi:hypothetical protein